MNERILELAEQAEKLADEETKAFTDDTGQWVLIWNEVYDKKFAELILSECIQYLNNEVDRLHKYRDSLPSWDENMKCECDLIIEKCMDNVQGLKEHFGIDTTK